MGKTNATAADVQLTNEELTPEVSNTGAAPEVPAVPKDSPYDLVEIQLFKDNRRYKDDLKVFVNGRNWVIQRGVPVKVPRYVANVIHRGQKQDMASDAMVMNLVERYEARTKEEAT